MEKKYPSSTKVVVVGGGVIGCSVAYHLTKFGWKDVVLLERDQLTSGTTWHAAGLVSQLGPTAAVTKIRKYTLDLYKKLEKEVEELNKLDQEVENESSKEEQNEMDNMRDEMIKDQKKEEKNIEKKNY